MISNNDRSWYIGASDTRFVVGNWTTKTFEDWWNIKLGFTEGMEQNLYMLAGSLYEHEILKHCEIPSWDEQIIVGRLRVNYDGLDLNNGWVVEVKTHKAENPFKITKPYWQQAQAEMWAAHLNRVAFISYGLVEDDYNAVGLGLTLPIDGKRIEWNFVERDNTWLKEEYLPKLNYLSHCLDERKFPTKEDLERWWKEFES